jgi:hypothetical protein
VKPLLVFSDDWGRHPSSCQHLVSHLLGTREVLWVNTIGTRPPRLDARTARRVMEKLGEWARPSTTPEIGSPNGLRAALAPRVLSPRMWPSFAGTAARSLNRLALKRGLKPIVEALTEPPIIITTLPIVTDLVGVLPAARWVYYCVDDFGVWPGYDGATMSKLERELVPAMDITIAASETLASGLRQLGARPHLLSHGVDMEFWAQPDSVPCDAPIPELAGIEGPCIVFWGVIDRRMDIDWLRALGEQLVAAGSPASIVLFGPQEDPDPALFRLPRVVVRDAVPFHRLPLVAAATRVLIMPYIDAPVTRAMQPLKLKEYLASGQAAVVRSLPSTQPWADTCDVCNDRDSFARAVLARLQSGATPSQLVERQRLMQESWSCKAKQFEFMIEPAQTREARQ